MSTTSSDVDTQERSFGDQVVKMFDCDRQEKQLFCDVIIQARGKRYAVHRAMLGLRCKFFEKLFTSEMKEKYAAVVKIDMDDDRFERILDYCYTGVADISSSNVTDLLDDAEYTELLDLKSECVSRMLQSVDVDNCLKLRSYALRYNLAQVAEKSNECIEDNFAAIVQQDDFKQLKVEELREFLKREKVKVLGEATYIGIVRWVNHEPNGRSHHFPKLFAQLDLSTCPGHFLRSTVHQEIMVRESFQCSNAVLDAAMQYMPIKIGEADDMSPYFLIFGGEGAVKQCVKIDVRNGETEVLPELIAARVGSAFVKYGNRILLCGGTMGDWDASPHKSCEMIDLNDLSKRMAKADMPETRMRAASSVLNDLVFVSGGRNYLQHILSTCYIYDFHRDIWFLDPAQMLKKRTSHAMVSLRGALYSIGGHDGAEYLAHCERYANHRWSAIAPLNQARGGLAVVVLGQWIYAIGGCDPKPLGSVERYDSTTEKWDEIRPMNVERAYHGVFVYLGKIYAVGGLKENSIEVYDPQEDSWTMEFNIPSLSDRCKVVST